MADCYLNKSKERYNCEYEEVNDGIKIIVDYDISKENHSKNNIIINYDGNEFEKIDILITDHIKKQYLLVKKAFFVGNKSYYSVNGGYEKSIFKSNAYIKHNDINKLQSLKETIKIKEIRIVFEGLFEFIPHNHSKKEIKNGDIVFKLFKNSNLNNVIDIGINNIKTLKVDDGWYCKDNRDKTEITRFGEITISLFKRITIQDCTIYLNELLLYLQLFCYNHFLEKEIRIKVDDDWYILKIDHFRISGNNFLPSTNVEFMSFIERCYKNIQYRNENISIRNIPNIIISTSRNIEDNYLMCYKFIESFYKRRGFNDNFIMQALNDSKINIDSFGDVEKCCFQLISLRNHYVHYGYHFKNNSLKIDFKDNKVRNYTERINVDWIYNRTILLYKIVLHIIFTDILNINKYNYKEFI